MKNSNELLRKVSEMLFRSLDESASEEQLSDMEGLLSSNEVARGHYFDLIYTCVSLNDTEGILGLDELLDIDPDAWQALLEMEQEAPEVATKKPEPEAGPEPKKQIPAKTAHKVNKFWLHVALFSTAALVLLFLFVLLDPPAGDNPVGLLSKTVNAQWQNPNGQISDGSALYTGPMSLVKGYAEIDFEDGATVIVEAPAKFSLESTHQMYVQEGRVVVKMNGVSEQLFVVRSPSASVVDLGTEFGVKVDSNGKTETHVFEGQIQVHDSSEPLRSTKKLLLTAGQGAVVRDGKLTAKEIDSEQFVRAGKFEWLLYSSQLRKDPSLVAYYTFEKDVVAPNKLKNAAVSTQGRLTGDFYSARRNGQLPKWTAGRWAGKSALELNREQDQVVVVPPDPALYIAGPITIAAWIKLETPEAGGPIVSCRQRKTRERGLINFQFGFGGSASAWKGRMQFVGRKDPGYSGPDFKDRVKSNQSFSDSDRWRLVAVTHDDKVVKFYLDGSLVDTQEFECYKEPVVNAYLTIGSNEIDGGSKFTGVMGELAIFKRVLSEEEVMKMYKAGKP